MSYKRGYEECYTLYINLEDKQTKNISYDVAPSNVSMFEMKIFGAGNKRNLTKMNPYPVLGQGRIRREIISHVIMF